MTITGTVISRPRYALAAMIFMSLSAQAAAPVEIQVFYRLDPWLVSGNYVGGLWVAPSPFGPVTQGGGTFTVQTKAQGIDALGQTVAVSPQWIASDPSMVAVSPAQGAEVTITVLKAGQSTVVVTADGLSRQLAIHATLPAAFLLVEISQQQAAPASQPSLSASPNLLTFTYQTGDAVPAAQSVSVGSSGPSLPFTASGDAAWLSSSAASGAAPATLNVSVDPAGLAAGTYSGTLTVISDGAANSPAAVAVVLNVTELPKPSLLVSPATLTFSHQSGGPDPVSQSASVASGGAQFPFTAAVGSGADWLSVTSSAGGTPAALVVSVHAAGLAAGSYDGTITVSSAGASNVLKNIAVSLTVTAPPPGPALSLTPSALRFDFQTGGSTPPAAEVSIGSSGSPLALGVSAAAVSGNWLSATPSGGNTPAKISVAADPRGLAAGTYAGTVSVSASGASNSPQVVPVTLVVTAAAAPSSTPAADLKFKFAVTSKQTGGSGRMVLSGSGQFGPAGLQGSGKFNETGPGGSHGEWKAKRLISFTPATPATSGKKAAGILQIEVALTRERGAETKATMKIVANAPEKGLFTGQPEGVTLAIADGATYAPLGNGSVALTVADGHDTDKDDHESDEH